ncbi:MAG: response regulator transcription factor [bacterium]|nr:response regulator transcription factor [bacterium]
MTRNILIVDDDPHILEIISFALDKAGMKTEMAADGQDALTTIKAHNFDLIVLDISMPELDGLEVCRELRKTSEVPVLFLSSRDEEIDRIVGLEIGGDDYVTKPFSVRELVARIKAILKRTTSVAPKEQGDEPLRHGGVVLEPRQHRVRFEKFDVQLTATEFSILKAFLDQPLRAFDRNNIIDKIYDFNIHVSDRTIDSHVRHIRNKFAVLGCDNLIETVHGIGYRLGSCR